MKIKVFCLVALALAAAAPARAQSAPNIYARKNVREVLARVFRWQVANPVEINLRNSNLWARAAFYTGVMAAHKSTGEREYLEQATRWADGRGWKLGERPRHADDHTPGQTYLELYMLR